MNAAKFGLFTPFGLCNDIARNSVTAHDRAAGYALPDFDNPFHFEQQRCLANDAAAAASLGHQRPLGRTSRTLLE
jgi:hypothetical protein